MSKFNEAKEKNLEKLNLFVPIVARVHGKAHPEFHDVSRLFQEIQGKIGKAGSETLELEEEFKELRKVTDDYTLPQDVCESYEAVYNMLAQLDKTYGIDGRED